MATERIDRERAATRHDRQRSLAGLFFVLLLAAAAASAGQTAILAFLPTLVDPARGAIVKRS
jgi:hypothetical protein